MAIAVVEVAAGLPMAASFAFAGGIAGLWEVRRRAVLNAALHELRRPLQAMALSRPATGEPFESSLGLAAVALGRLEGAINGAKFERVEEPVEMRALATAAVRRWGPRARRQGVRLRLDWRGSGRTLIGDPAELAQALDNLITNGIEHGGGTVVVAGAPGPTGVRLTVCDSGIRRPARSRWRSRARRLIGSGRHGHGLRVVRAAATAHGGSFRLRRLGPGTEAVLVLPREERG